MIKWLTLFSLPFLLFAGDFQVWNTDSINIQAGRKVILRGESQFRYEKKGRKLSYKHYQGGILFVRSSHFLIQTAYVQAYRRIDKKWREESRPFLDLTFQAQSRPGWYIGDRNRIEYRILGKHLGGKDRWRYRNRLEIIPPHRITKKRIALYVSNEFFWQEGRGIDQNRAEIGLKIPYHQRTQLELSYMYRSHKNLEKDWTYHNVAWVHFSLNF